MRGACATDVIDPDYMQKLATMSSGDLEVELQKLSKMHQAGDCSEAVGQSRIWIDEVLE